MAGEGKSGTERSMASLQNPCVFLTDLSPAYADITALADIAHRLGFLSNPRGLASAESSLMLDFSSTTVRCTTGAVAQAMLASALEQSADPQALGDVECGIPADAVVLALELEGWDSAIQGTTTPENILSVQHICCMAAMFSAAVGAPRLYWVPAALWSFTEELGLAISAMEDEGLPPILHLVAFRSLTSKDGKSVLRTRGLQLFVGAELAMEYPTDFTAAEALRRLARLSIHVMLAGLPIAGTHIPGMRRGEVLTVGAYALAQRNDQPVSYIPVALTTIARP